MKKMMSVLLIVFIVLSLVGCSKKAEDPTTTTTAATTETTTEPTTESGPKKATLGEMTYTYDSQYFLMEKENSHQIMFYKGANAVLTASELTKDASGLSDSAISILLDSALDSVLKNYETTNLQKSNLDLNGKSAKAATAIFKVDGVYYSGMIVMCMHNNTRYMFSLMTSQDVENASVYGDAFSEMLNSITFA